ncbi:MAG: diguanylate cyclase, partial [Cellvibrionaceae bacterium]|nr:diguanylate cyclase [Cellvibrionaceae bacterium]
MTLYSAMYSLLTINFIIALTALYALWRYSQAQGLGLWGLVLAISLAISTAIGFALNRQLRLGAEAGDSSDIVSRDVFLERFNLCLALAERQRSSLSVAKLRLKNIDSLSVEEEAAVLASCAQLLQQSLREEDSLAWRGGDEFLALLPGANSEQARMVVERMLEQLQHQGAG